MPKNQHELNRRARNASYAHSMAATERRASNAGKGARAKANRDVRFLRLLRDVIRPAKQR